MYSVGMSGHGLRERKKEQTRARLMAAALRLFDERGYDGATVELIAAEAEVSVPTFFRYFESKEDVFLASPRSLLDRVERMILERPAGVPALTALRKVLEEVLREMPRLADQRADMKAFHSVPQLKDRMREYEDHVRQVLTDAFAEELGVETSDLRPQMLAGCVESAFGAARREWLEGAREEPLDVCLKRALDLVEQMAEPIFRAREKVSEATKPSTRRSARNSSG